LLRPRNICVCGWQHKFDPVTTVFAGPVQRYISLFQAKRD